MKEYNWRENISAILTYRLRGYLREVKRIKRTVSKHIPAVNADDRELWEYEMIQVAKERWF